MSGDVPGVDTNAFGGRRPVRTGLVGYGYWGKKLLASLQASDDFVPQRLHYPSLLQMAEADRPQLLGVTLTDTLEALLADPELDAVVLATPIDCHGEGVRAALTSGKHVLVAKPLCLDPSEAHDLARLAEGRNLQLQTEYTWAFSPSLREAQRLVDDGLIGRVTQVHVRLHQLGRFLEHDVYPLLVSHALSIVSMFLDPTQVVWTQRAAVGPDEATTTVVLSGVAADGATVVIDASLDDPERDRSVLLVGEEGSVRFGPLGEGPTLVALRYSRQPTGTLESSSRVAREVTYDESDNIGQALAAFARVLRGEEPSNIQQSVGITEVMARLCSLAEAPRVRAAD